MTAILIAWGHMNYTAKYHPDPIWNDGALGFLKRGAREKEDDDDDDDDDG